ncbi:hypothetical protein ACT4S2_02740 [Kocuria turfanensis]|uniref:hypothetical protein n=1 Tax=Kocuria turfanensis TaxID=388357 RepID=UPI004036A155
MNEATVGGAFLLAIGAGSLIGALIGGGVEIGGKVKFPLIHSRLVRASLALLGVLFLVLGLMLMLFTPQISTVASPFFERLVTPGPAIASATPRSLEPESSATTASVSPSPESPPTSGSADPTPGSSTTGGSADPTQGSSTTGGSADPTPDSAPTSSSAPSTTNSSSTATPSPEESLHVTRSAYIDLLDDLCLAWVPEINAVDQDIRDENEGLISGQERMANYFASWQADLERVSDTYGEINITPDMRNSLMSMQQALRGMVEYPASADPEKYMEFADQYNEGLGQFRSVVKPEDLPYCQDL